MPLQSTFVPSPQVADEKYMMVGKSSFLLFPGEDLKQARLTVCTCWRGQTQYFYCKSMEWGDGKIY